MSNSKRERRRRSPLLARQEVARAYETLRWWLTAEVVGPDATCLAEGVVAALSWELGLSPEGAGRAAVHRLLDAAAEA